MSRTPATARAVVTASHLQHCERCVEPILPGETCLYLKDAKTGAARYLHTTRWGRDLWKRKAKSIRQENEWYRVELRRLRERFEEVEAELASERRIAAYWLAEARKAPLLAPTQSETPEQERQDG